MRTSVLGSTLRSLSGEKTPAGHDGGAVGIPALLEQGEDPLKAELFVDRVHEKQDADGKCFIVGRPRYDCPCFVFIDHKLHNKDTSFTS